MRRGLKISHRRLDGAPGKKEFEAFAKILCRHDAGLPLVRDFADYFAEVNPRFNRDYFIDAVGKCKR